MKLELTIENYICSINTEEITNILNKGKKTMIINLTQNEVQRLRNIYRPLYNYLSIEDKDFIIRLEMIIDTAKIEADKQFAPSDI